MHSRTPQPTGRPLPSPPRTTNPQRCTTTLSARGQPRYTPPTPSILARRGSTAGNGAQLAGFEETHQVCLARRAQGLTLAGGCQMAALEPTEPRRLQLPNERSGEVSGQGGLAAAAKLVVGARASTCGATIRTRPTTPSLELRRWIGARFAHSLAIRQLDAGSCNGCGICSRPSRPQVDPVPTFHCVRASSRRFTKFALPRTPSLSAGPTRDVYATGMTQSDLCFPLAPS